MLLDKRQLTFSYIQNMLYLWTKLAATQVKKGIEQEVKKNRKQRDSSKRNSNHKL
jgi:hypothetical protein